MITHAMTVSQGNELDMYGEIREKRVHNDGLQPPQYSRSAPTTRHPLRLTCSLNESPNIVSEKEYLTSRSYSNTLYLKMIYDRNARFRNNCENFEIFVNECNKTRNLQLEKNNFNNLSKTSIEHSKSINEGNESYLIAGNNHGDHRLVRSILSNSHLIRNARGQRTENNITKAIRDCSISPMRTVRSLGKASSTREFASRFSSRSKPPRSIRLHNSEPSSFFEIESENTSELAEESPILYNNIEATITAPHQPPFSLQIGTNQSEYLKTNNFLSQNNISLTRTDYFQEYMEERMARWRPSNSQFNVEDTMEGKHPYQQENFDPVVKAAKTKLYNPFTALKTWFNGRTAVSDLENQIQDITYSNTNKATNELTQDTPLIQLPEIAERIRKIDFKVNSSNSIIPKPFKTGDCSHITKGLRDTLAKQESTPLDGPSYTPKALPFNDYDLNFDAKDCFSIHKTEQDSNGIIDSMDEDIRDLLNGFDNFLADCLRNIWNTCSPICGLCLNLT